MIDLQPAKRPKFMKQETWQGRPIACYSNRIIVKFKPPPADEDRSVDDLVETICNVIPKGFVLRRPNASGRVLYGVDPKADLIKIVETIAARDDVEYAEPDVIDRAAVVPSDTRYGDQWALPQVNAPAAWDLETGATAGVLIGIIDSGISMSAAGALDHPDLDSGTRYILGTDFVDGGDPRDLRGHGTHVAGIAAAESDNSQGVCGMNWQTSVYICRTLDADGNGGSADFADAVEEIVDYAVAHSMKVVINYSAGGGDNQTKKDACKYVNDHGMVLCAATGNDYGGAVIHPAAYSADYDGVIAVGSTNDDDTVSDFSNVGPEVTVVAPGRNILSTTPTYNVTIPVSINYDYMDGTSMATPLVTGLVSLMWSRHPSFSNKKIRDCLTGTAVKLGAGNFDNAWGYGRVDAEKALRCGDLTFTRFTKFTALTRFTKFTALTRFTKFTGLTRFTKFTRFTRVTSFTRLTPFTRFSPITHFSFPPQTRFVDPRHEDEPLRPFVRFANAVFAPDELALGRFEEFAGMCEHLSAADITRIDQLAAFAAEDLGRLLGISAAQAVRLIHHGQALLKRLADSE